MARLKLDKIDLKILRNLQDNGRMTNVDLAKNAGISPPPCLRRVRTLEDTGCIRGYHADIDTEALGFGVTVFANVGLHSQAEADLVAFEERVSQWPKCANATCWRGNRLSIENRRLGLGRLPEIPDDQSYPGPEC